MQLCTYHLDDVYLFILFSGNIFNLPSFKYVFMFWWQIKSAFSSYRGGLAGCCCRHWSFWLWVRSSICSESVSANFHCCLLHDQIIKSTSYRYIYHLTLGGFALTFPLGGVGINVSSFDPNNLGSDRSKINLRATIYRCDDFSLFNFCQ